MTLQEMREGAPMPAPVNANECVICTGCPVDCYMRDRYQRNPCALGECPRLQRWGATEADAR